MLFPALAGLFLRGTCLVGFSLVLRAALRDRLSAAARYRVVFLSLAALPFIATLSFFQAVPSFGAEASESVVARSGGTSEESLPALPGPSGEAARLWIPEVAADCLVALWGLVAASLVLRAVAVRMSASRLVGSLALCSDPGWREALAAAEEKFRLRRGVRLLDGGLLPPFTGGLTGRCVAVPAAGRTWSGAEREAALLHEVAHVARRDVLGMAAADLVAAVFWFCPPVHVALAALREDREEACDAMAVGAGAGASEFASLILSLAASRSGPGVPGCATEISEPTKVERRISAILGLDGAPRGREVLGRVATVALLIAISGAASASGAAGLFAVETTATVTVGTVGADGAPTMVRLSLSGLPTAAPLDGPGWRVSQPFGEHANPLTGKQFVHTGIDLTDGKSGDPVRSTLDGRVNASGFDETQGNFVVVGQGDLAVRFLKLRTRRVSVGEKVSVGTILGTVGDTGVATGPHLHYEVWVKGAPVDPAALLRVGGARFEGL